MRRHELSKDADRDFDNLLSWGKIWFGERVAAAYFFSFEATFDLLIRHPLAGAKYENVLGDVRVFKHKSHRVFYRVNEDYILIARVLHYAVDAPRALR